MSEAKELKAIEQPKKEKINVMDMVNQVQICDQKIQECLVKIEEQKGILKKYEGMKEYCTFALTSFVWDAPPVPPAPEKK